jgi:hypothetical protein
MNTIGHADPAPTTSLRQRAAQGGATLPLIDRAPSVLGQLESQFLDCDRLGLRSRRSSFIARSQLDFVHSTPHTQGRPQRGSICGAEFLYCLGAAGT